MSKKRHKAAISDLRPTRELARELLALRQAGEEDGPLHILHARGSRQELQVGAQFCQGATAVERILGADILAQLGWDEHTYLQESTDCLLPLLADSDPVVIRAAAIALGHRNSPRAIRHALPLVRHANADVRFGAVWALSGHNDSKAIDGLIELSSDKDRDVRNWATFALASQTDMDTPDLRNALFERTKDGDAEIRGEALIGLASRGDMRVVEPLKNELAGIFHGAWAIEAAHLLALDDLHPLLSDLQARLAPDDLQAFDKDLRQALAACNKSHKN